MGMQRAGKLAAVLKQVAKGSGVRAEQRRWRTKRHLHQTISQQVSFTLAL